MNERELLGYAMAAYKGGWVECGIRKWPVPVCVLDVRSTYPTLATLLGLQNFLAAESIRITDTTVQTRALLAEVDLDACLDPTFWRKLWTFVRVKPSGDILPVKARLSHDRQWDMLVPRVDGGDSLWMHLGDVVNSKLATGRIPKIDRAITVTPVGQMPGLIPMRLRGSVEVDPRRPDDLFRVSVEERERFRKGGTAEGTRTEKFLKGFGNTIGYRADGEEPTEI